MNQRTGISILGELATKTFLANRTPETTPEEEAATFAKLSGYRNGAIYVGAFAGTSCWERHGSGEEIVQVFGGCLELTILEGRSEQTLVLEEGTLAVVPEGLWHRLHAPGPGATVMTVTPLPTETALDDPRAVEQDARDAAASQLT